MKLAAEPLFHGIGAEGLEHVCSRVFRQFTERHLLLITPSEILAIVVPAVGDAPCRCPVLDDRTHVTHVNVEIAEKDDRMVSIDKPTLILVLHVIDDLGERRRPLITHKVIIVCGVEGALTANDYLVRVRVEAGRGVGVCVVKRGLDDVNRDRTGEQGKAGEEEGSSKHGVEVCHCCRARSLGDVHNPEMAWKRS